MNGCEFTTRRACALRVVILQMTHLSMRNFNYLIIDPASRQALIVDPAWQMEKIDAALQCEGLQLRGILVTHSHPDHIHLAQPLADKHHCPIYMSREEIALSGFRAKHLIGIDATPWRVGDMLIRPLLTPGHTAGGVCYLIDDALFTGDTLFAEGCGMCPDVSAAHTLYASLQYLKRTLVPQTRIYPGHSYGKPPGQPFAQILQDNIYMQFTSKESFAAFRLRRNQYIPNIFGQ